MGGGRILRWGWFWKGKCLSETADCGDPGEVTDGKFGLLFLEGVINFTFQCDPALADRYLQVVCRNICIPFESADYSRSQIGVGAFGIAVQLHCEVIGHCFDTLNSLGSVLGC